MSTKSDLSKSTFRIDKMDCPSEENIIHMKLDNIPHIKKMEFDIPNRTLHVYHKDGLDEIKSGIEELNFGSTLVDTKITDGIVDEEDTARQKKILWAVLAINFTFFAVEIIAGILAGSMGLVGDSLDMLASAIFTSNDIIVNLGVMLAGLLVQVTATRYPDLIIGGILFMVVARGAFKILKLSK